MSRAQIMRAMAAALFSLLASCTEIPQGGYGQATATPAPDTPPTTPPATVSVPAVPKGGFATAIATAVRTNPDLGRATADLRSAEARARATKGAFLPTISLGLDAKSRSARSAAAAPVTPYLRVSQLVYDGGASTNRRSAAQARVAESRGNRVETAAAAALAAVERYSAVLTGRALLALANDNLAAHETLLAQIEQRVSTGAGVTSDRLSAQARLAEARSLQISRLAGLERAQADYRQAFGTQAGALPQPSPRPGRHDGADHRRQPTGAGQQRPHSGRLGRFGRRARPALAQRDCRAGRAAPGRWQHRCGAGYVVELQP